MTDRKPFERDEVIEQQLIEFADGVRRAVAGRFSTVIVTFDDGKTSSVTSKFTPDSNTEMDILAYVFPILTLAQTVFDTAKMPIKVTLTLPDGSVFSEWNEVLENRTAGT